MRFETAGELPRLDLAPIVDLLPALRAEWSELRFDAAGRLVNPLTGGTVDALALLGGRHRQPGAVYRLTVTLPKLELPDERRAEFEKEARKLSRRNAKQAQWDEHFARRRGASVQVGTEQEHVRATLREDDSRRLACSVSDEDEHWALDIVLEHGLLPKIDLDGRVDLTASIKANGTPGCLATFLGGTGDGSAVLDLGTLERSGRVIEAAGRANRFRGSAELDVQASATRWVVTGDGRLRARGLGRFVLWFAGRPIRRSVDQSLREFWASGESQAAELEKEISQLRAAVEEEGGAAPFVRRALWDDDFDPGLDSFRVRPRKP